MSKVEVDGELAERAERIAASRGEDIQEVIERALAAYVDEDPKTKP